MATEKLTQYQLDQLHQKLADEAIIASLYGSDAEVFPAPENEWYEYFCEFCPQYGECHVCGQRHGDSR